MLRSASPSEEHSVGRSGRRAPLASGPAFHAGFDPPTHGSTLATPGAALYRLVREDWLPELASSRDSGPPSVVHHVSCICEGIEMGPVEAISRILQSTRGSGICDACLAFAIEMPLATVQTVNNTLSMIPADYVRISARCHHCGRVTMTTAFIGVVVEAEHPVTTLRRRKCARCSRRVIKADEHVHNGDLFHRQCWAVLQSQAEIANSRQMLRLSRALIRRSRDRLQRDEGDSSVPDA